MHAIRMKGSTGRSRKKNEKEREKSRTISHLHCAREDVGDVMEIGQNPRTCWWDDAQQRVEVEHGHMQEGKHDMRSVKLVLFNPHPL